MVLGDNYVEFRDCYEKEGNSRVSFTTFAMTKITMLFTKHEIDFKPIITQCFSTDEELLSTFHVKAPATLQECVDDTFDKITNGKDFKFYSLRNEKDELVGYFGAENDNG